MTKEEQRTANKGLKEMAGEVVNQTFVLRNRQLFVAAKRYSQNGRMTVPTTTDRPEFETYRIDKRS